MRQRAGSTTDSIETGRSDENLIAELLRRDNRAWREFEQRFGASLKGRVVAVVAKYGSEVEASDTVQDILAGFRLALLERDMLKLRVFDANKNASLRGWLAKLVENHTLNVLRGMRLRQGETLADNMEEQGAAIGALWCAPSLENDELCDAVV
jgi:hypothetical protein